MRRRKLELPVWRHRLLAGILFVTVLVASAPALLLLEYVTNFYPIFLFGQVALVAIMSYVSFCDDSDNDGDTHHVRVSQHNIRRLTHLTIGSLLLTAVPLGNLSLALGGCTYRGPDADAECAWLYELAANGTSSCQALQRRPGFATETLWHQLCIEEQPLAITDVVAYAAAILVDMLILVHLSRARLIRDGVAGDSDSSSGDNDSR